VPKQSIDESINRSINQLINPTTNPQKKQPRSIKSSNKAINRGSNPDNRKWLRRQGQHDKQGRAVDQFIKSIGRVNWSRKQSSGIQSSKKGIEAIKSSCVDKGGMASKEEAVNQSIKSIKQRYRSERRRKYKVQLAKRLSIEQAAAQPAKV
jgi:hypothetical protein